MQITIEEFMKGKAMTRDDRLRRFEAGVEALERILKENPPRWRAVGKELPQVGELVLVAIRPTIWNSENQADLELLEYTKDGFCWRDEGTPLAHQDRVVYWQHLIPPEPPE